MSDRDIDELFGHNQGAFAVDQLKGFVDRIERLEAEKSDLSSDIRDVYAEARATGFDVKAVRAIIRMRKKEEEERKAEEEMINLYKDALDMS